MTAVPTSPYKGLNAFEDSDLDALLFFGREREREIVVANLIASRLTVLYGPSGVGKSSLLRAAVARSLRDLPEEPVVVVFSRWSDDPARALASALADATGAPDAGLVEALEEAQAARDVYLILDQAEEYFLYHADDHGPGSFADALPRVLGPSLRVNVLVSLREDSLAKLDRFTGRVPGLFANTLRLDRLDRASAEAAIVRPVERYVELAGEPASLEPALVQRVLDEVGTGQIATAFGGLGAVDEALGAVGIEAPYLQLVMQRLWEEERAVGSTDLRVETLERLGGAQHIVEEHLASAMDSLSAGQKDVASRLFNHLVTPSGTKIAHEVSDLADFGDVSVSEVQAVLDVLAERRILRSLEEGGAVRYEIFHDVLAHPVLAWRARHRTERAVERQLEERGRRRARLQRIFVIGAGAVVVLAAAMAFALVQRSSADEQARNAQGRELDAAAVTLLATDPELGLLLARESAEMSPGPVAEDALREALLASRARGLIRTGGAIEDVEYSPDGRRVAVASDDGRVSVRDVESGDEVAGVEAGAGAGASFSSQGDAVLVFGDTTAPSYVDLGTGEVGCVLGKEGEPAAGAVIAGDYGVVVRNGRGFVWNLEDCALEKTIDEVGKAAVRIVASSDGRRVAFVSGRQALIANPDTGRVLYRLEHPGLITSLDFSSDSGRLVTGGRDQLTRVWNGATGALERELSGQKGQILDVAIDPAGTSVATVSMDGTGRIWDLPSGAVQAVLFGHTNFVESVEFSADGEYLVTSSLDGTARTWAVNGRPTAVLAGHSGAVVDARFSPDGTMVATGAQDGTVRFWDAGTRRDLTRGNAPAPALPTLEATSPDGDTTARIDGKVIRLERADGTTADLEGHELGVTSVAFSPDGRRLVSAGRDRNAVLWDVASGKALRQLRGHFGTVSDARFSPDGRWIVTAGPRSVGLWKASTGELVKLLGSPEGPFTAVEFLPDSRTIVALSGGDTVSVYDCRICGEIPELLEFADERLAATGRELTPEERELYLG